MIRVPKQLQNPEFRFFLATHNDKLPIEKLWNSTKNYPFFHERLLRHHGNYGIVTGFGNVIVLDFDSREYYESMCNKLPVTFTVLSARKKLPHLYYILNGEMFKKVGIDVKGKRVLDIQGDHCGIVAPGSTIDRSYYHIINNRPLTEIDLNLLKTIFEFNPRKRQEFIGDTTPRPEKVQETLNILHGLGMKETKPLIFKCPFHEMQGTGNLHVLDDGKLYCFHEQRSWRDGKSFAEDVQHG
jgi:hypothetical protein